MTAVRSKWPILLASGYVHWINIVQAVLNGNNEINVGCGKVTEDQRFGHGSDSNIIVPWAATVTPTSGDKDDKPFAAKIVSPSLILTSANYFLALGTTRFKIYPSENYLITVNSTRFGALSGLSSVSKPQTRRASHISIHPNFERTITWVDTKNDVALIHLDSPLEFSNFVRPVCLPSKEMRDSFFHKTQEYDSEDESVHLFGWNTKVSDIISLRLRILPRNNCIARWNNKTGAHGISNGLGERFCATTGTKNNHTNCIHRDVGGYFEANRTFYLAGIVNNFYSNNQNCSQGAVFFFWKYTDETYAWIENNIKCGPKNFTCGGTGKCIPLSDTCNRKVDCLDGSDESEQFCRGLHFCTDQEFACGVYDKCINRTKVKDGVKDCPGGEDEMGYVDNTPLMIGLIASGVCAFIILVIVDLVLKRARTMKKQIRDLTLTMNEVDEFMMGAESASTADLTNCKSMEGK